MWKYILSFNFSFDQTMKYSVAKLIRQTNAINLNGASYI